MEPVAMHLARTGELIGEIHSVDVAHRIAHLYLGEWPDLGAIIVVDREHGNKWRVAPGVCGPFVCGIALELAEAPQTRREFIADLVGVPLASYRPAVTEGGLPVRALPQSPGRR
jgi:hypothetical protein